MPSIKPWVAAGQSGQGKGLPWASSRSNSAQVYISIARIMMLRWARTWWFYAFIWNPQFNGLNRRGFNFFGVWDPLYHAALNDARFADREVGIAP
jgi:hypothetical protein